MIELQIETHPNKGTAMMTTYTLKMFCLQNRTDIARLDKIRHLLGTDVVVTFNDESSVHLRYATAEPALTTFEQLMAFTHPIQ